jgi:molybdopterin-guanine dinucleotide biosynthesis protein A
MTLAPEASWPVTALVLAGGRGSRMGGVDKGLVRLQGVPLVQWAVQRLRAQVTDAADAGVAPLQLALNANREWADYAAFGLPVWPDPVGHFAGPLAGFAAGLQHCHTPLLLTVPCDVPLFPLDLLRRLRHALLQQQADMALAAAPDECGTLRWQPVFCLMRASLRPSLLDYIAQGGAKVQAWARTQRCAVVPFDAPTDNPLAFRNLNTPQELRELEAQLAALGAGAGLPLDRPMAPQPAPG